MQLTEEEWQEKDRRFERLIKKKKGLSIRQNYNQVLKSTVFPLYIHLTICNQIGYNIKKMQEDGSCLFRAVADQIYGDEEMHTSVRRHCMDYIVSNRRNAY